MKPVRIQRKRTKGFNLQKVSMDLNGLPCVSCTRPGKWGNPFTVEQYYNAGYSGKYTVAAKHCVDAYEAWLIGKDHWGHGKLKEVPNISELKGKNLACWCKEGEPCHVDVLLEICNK